MSPRKARDTAKNQAQVLNTIVAAAVLALELEPRGIRGIPDLPFPRLLRPRCRPAQPALALALALVLGRGMPHPAARRPGPFPALTRRWQALNQSPSKKKKTTTTTT